MCGIFAFAGPSSFRAAALLQALTIADQVRGEHSTGLAVAARKENSRRLSPRLAKKALSGKEFVRAGWSRLLFHEKYPLAIGHNRYATAGEVNDRNAHPFFIPRPHGAALAAHNGIVGGKEAIAERYGVKNYPVDSEVYFRAIGREAGKDEASLVGAIDRVTQFIAPRADFACLWMEPAWRTLYFWRSEGRPLSVIDARAVGLGRFLCSTVEIFSAAWGQIRGMLPSIKKTEFFEARPFSIYRVKDDGEWEVERIHDIAHSKAPDAPSGGSGAACPLQKTLPFRTASSDLGSEDEGQGARGFACSVCYLVVTDEDAVFIDPRTGRLGEVGKPCHPDCASALIRTPAAGGGGA